jgi:Cys-tRNA(Pro) deacylase
MLMSEAVKNYLDKAGVGYKIHTANGPTMTAQDAATRLNVPLETIIKSIVLTAQDGSPLIAIVTGDKRVDRRKLSDIAGTSKVRIASAEDTKTATGFEVGSMPPLGHRSPITTVIDRKVMGFSKVYGGAGTSDALIEINPRDIARLTDAKVADICE